MTNTTTITASTHSANTFSVVIPAWNESAQIGATVDAVKNAVSCQPFDGDIIVVDNNSTDDTAKKAASAGAQVVFEPVNQIARARNAGAQASNADWLVFIDADSIVNPELLTASLQALHGGTVLGGGSAVAMQPTLTGLPNQVLRFWNWWSVKSSTAAGCYIYCTKAAFDAIGGFDERYYAAEELHLSKKMRALAKKRGQQFVIQTHSPIVSSSRKMEWYTPWQLFKQTLLVLLPGATRSRKLLGVWYDRSKISKDGGCDNKE